MRRNRCLFLCISIYSCNIWRTYVFIKLLCGQNYTDALQVAVETALAQQDVTAARKDAVQSELVQALNIAQVKKAADAEQALRTASSAPPPAAVSDAKASMQEQLLAVSSLVTSKDAEEEERTRRVQENKMHDVSQQLQQEASAKAVDAAMDTEK